MKEVLNGGYNVHPVPPPNSEIKERITKRYEREKPLLFESRENLWTLLESKIRPAASTSTHKQS